MNDDDRMTPMGMAKLMERAEALSYAGDNFQAAINILLTSLLEGVAEIREAILEQTALMRELADEDEDGGENEHYPPSVGETRFSDSFLDT